MSINPNITLDIIEQNPQYPWNMSAFLMNPNLTWDLFTANYSKYSNQWFRSNLVRLSVNPNITVDIFYQNRDWIPWSIYELTRNANITWQDIQNHPDIGWDFFDILENPNISWDLYENTLIYSCNTKNHFLQVLANLHF
jgi:hypothetical protein